MLIETYDRGLRFETGFFHESLLDGTHPMFAFFNVRRFEQQLIIRDSEMAMEQRDAKSAEGPVFFEYMPYLFQTIGIAFINRPNIVDMFETTPLQRIHSDLSHLIVLECG